MFALICGLSSVLSSVCFSCALIRVLSSVLSSVCSHMCSHLCVLIIITATSLVSFCPPTLFGVSCRDNLFQHFWVNTRSASVFPFLPFPGHGGHSGVGAVICPRFFEGVSSMSQISGGLKHHGKELYDFKSLLLVLVPELVLLL